MSPATFVSACSSAPSPIAHQGQDTSETKSILSWVVMVAVCSEVGSGLPLSAPRSAHRVRMGCERRPTCLRRV